MNVTIDSKFSAMIVIDMQKDFCYETGALFLPNAKRIISKTEELISNATSHCVQMIFTQDWHTPDDPEFDIWGEHCVQNTEGADIIDELSVHGHIVRKRGYSAFFGTDLDSFLKERGIRTLLIVGVATNICVLHTTGDARLRGYDIVIPEDCVAALEDYDQEYAIHHISFVLNGKIASSEEIEFLN
jgi:nicotinamidase-related amidase